MNRLLPCLLMAAALPLSGGGRALPVVMDEDFSAPTTVSPVRNFSAYGGVWSAREGVLHAGADAGPKLISDAPPLAAGEVGVEMLLPDQRGGNAGLIVKVSQPGIGADRFNGYEIALDASAQALRLGRHRQNFELIRDVPCAVRVNEWIPVVARLTGNSIEVLVNGQSLIRYEDKERPLKEGQVGLRPWQREARYRNLWIRREGQTQPVPFVAATPDAAQNIGAGWRAVRHGAARGEFALAAPGPRAGQTSQRITFRDGVGEIGIGRPVSVVAQKPWRGFLWVRSDAATEIVAAFESADSAPVAEARLKVAGGDWQPINFSLSPAIAPADGQFVIKLKSPGSALIGRVRLEPGDWAWPETLALQKVPAILFLRRPMLSSPPVVGCDLWAARPTAPGAAIRIWDAAHNSAPLRTVFEDPEGSIYDLNLSLDARTVYFSYARQGEKHWHLWRIGVDGAGLRQITDGPYYDVGPCETPDGNLIFVSTRRFGHTVCQPGPASNLYRVSPNGGTPQCLSMNSLSDTTPQLLPDGRVLFMRWEYVDRDLTYRQSLWTQNPDGAGYQLYFGNTIRDPGTFWQARPIPGRSDRVLATFAPHHGYPHGAIGWIERNHGPETPRGAGFDWITQEFPTIGDQAQSWAYRDPFPLDAESFLCAYSGGAQRFRIFLHDVQDRRRLVYEDMRQHCFFPIALRSTPRPPVLAERAPAKKSGAPDLPEEHPASAQPMGRCILTDVYRGLEPAIARGRVKYIRIMEQIRKTEDIPVIPHIVDFGPRAYDQSPLMSYGTYYAKRCWGTVPVESDGSAHFLAPALREIYFQACDAEGRELQRMTSGAQVMPGETVGCAGCHESRAAAPVSNQMPLAARRPPSVPKPPEWAPDGVIDFVSVVQPVLDKYCVKCHSGGNPDGGYDLSGDKSRFFNQAYDNLLGRSRSYRQHKMDTGEMLPQEAAKGKPLVHFYWLLQTPTAVNQPLWTGSHASRLPEYLDEKHVGQPMPPEDRLRIYTWIDADVPYYGTYATVRPRAGGKRDLCADAKTGEPAEWFAQEFQPVYQRRCASCHGDFPSTRLVTCWDGRTAWINFTRPELSAALTAHLAKSAGGRGITTPKNGAPPPRFESTADPDYAVMRRAFETGKRQALAAPGADMPGFTAARKEP